MNNRVGFDASYWQVSFNLVTAKSRGLDFGFFRSTRGGDYIDTTYKKFWSDAGAAGIDRGSYHYFINSVDPVMQARFFLKNSFTGELPRVIDLEDTSVWARVVSKVRGVMYAVTATALTPQERNVKLFVDTVEQETGVRPIIYSNPSWIATYLRDPSWSSYPLWLANYVATAPSVPAPWIPGFDPLIWQIGQRNGIYYGAGSPKLDINAMRHS